MAHANRYSLYWRTSASTGKEIIAIYSPDKDLAVYEEKQWWSDAWDPLDYGKAVVTDQPVFGQLDSLFRSVPLMGLFNDGNENCPYVNWTGWAKNCHLSYGVDYCEDTLYSESLYHCRSCEDCHYGYRLERCYECIDCMDCYGLLFGQNCTTCTDSAFLFDCIGCANCFGSTNLRRQHYRYFNEQLTKEEYEKRIRSHFPLTDAGITDIRKRWIELRNSMPQQATFGTGNFNATGDLLFNCKNASACFDCTDLEDCKNCTNVRGAKDCRDINFWGHPGELCYEDVGVGEGATRVLFTINTWGGTTDMLYCFSCIGCCHCFGCAGLRHKQYCILNKQYTKEEYERIVPQIIGQMRRSGEWGEFFPVERSLFAYNETLAQAFFPLSREQIEARGWRFHQMTDEIPKVERIIPGKELPDRITDIPDDILNWAIECAVTRRPFRITKMELEFHRSMEIPIPRMHPDERHRSRMALKNPRKLWNRRCGKCEKGIESTYSPDRPETVYCERCYLETVY